MKLRLFVLALLYIVTTNAQTVISQDTVYGLWTLANSPYTITKNILIPTGERLIIEPGVRVQFSPNTGLTVYGSLYAVGNEIDTIKFTTLPGGNPWRQIRIINTDSTSQDSTVISYAMIDKTFISETDTIKFTSGALFLKDASKVLIDHVLLKENMAAVVANVLPYSSAIYALRSKFKVSNTTIFKNDFDSHANNIINVVNSNSSFENIVIDSSRAYEGCTVTFDGGEADIKSFQIKNNNAWVGWGSASNDAMEVTNGKFNLSLVSIQNCENHAGLKLKYLDTASQITNVSIVDSKFPSNSAALNYEGHNEIRIYNTLIANNNGPGIRISENDNSTIANNRLKLINCVIANNTGEALNRHNTLYEASDSCTVEFRNCIVWGNGDGVVISNPGKERIDVYYSDFQYPYTKLNMHEGNLHTSPEFSSVNSSEYHLTLNSPCVDAGDPHAIYNDKKRSVIAGLGSVRNDMGAYGGIFNSWNTDVQASFFVSDTLGKAPLIVKFTDKSINQPTSWKWDLNGDGSIDSYDQNPSYTYTHPGKYTVTLVAQKRGSSDTMMVKDCVVIPPFVVSGEVSGNWIHDTIKVVGDINIPSGSVLTINPKTVVYFTGNYQFAINGQLVANGTPSERIIFVTDSLYESGGNYYGWKGMHFSRIIGQVDPTSELTYAIVRNVSGSPLQFTNINGCKLQNVSIDNFSGKGVKATNSSLLFDSVSIRNGIAATGLYAETCTLKVNKGTFSYIGDGSAIRVYNSDLEIKYATIDSNTVRYDYGGGIYSNATTLKMANSIIKHNFAERGGGGIYFIGEKEVLLQSVQLTDNIVSSGGGGGAAFLDCKPQLYNVTVTGNRASEWGGGLFINTALNWQTLHPATIENCIIAKNTSTIENRDGGGIYLGYNIAGKITNTTIADNKSTHWAGLYSENTSLPHYFKNVIVYNNGPDRPFQAGAGPYVYSLVQGNYNGMDTTTTNLTGVAPLFVDTLTGNYHLQSIQSGFVSNSPAIDKGDPTIFDAVLGNDNGLLTSRSDMGAYGGARNNWPGNYLPPCYYSGKVNGVWSCSTISVLDDIYIDKGDTLIINPGTKVVFLKDAKFTVNGVLLSEGTADNRITFTSADTIVGWRGITFSGLDTTSVGWSKFDYTTFLYSQAKGTGNEKRGGAIYINKSSKISIKNTQFYHNKADELGGALYISQSVPTIKGCTFEKNSAVLAGGAVYFDNVTSGTFSRLEVKQNRAKEGAGLFFDHSSPLISNMLLVNNSTTIEGVGTGGGMFLYWSSPKITNVTSSMNFAGNGGGAIGLNGTCNPTILNSIFAYDEKPEINYNPSVYNFPVKYSIIEGGAGSTLMGQGSLDTIPDFISITQGNYHLQSSNCGFISTSVGVDGGHPDSLDNQVTCGYGLGSPRADMGYYGGRFADISVAVEEEQKNEMPTAYGLDQNYPNPFNPSTIIRYHLPVSGYTSIIVYDILGREVTKLVDEFREAGTHNITFNAGRLASGVYIYRIKSGNYLQSKKLLLIK